MTEQDKFPEEVKESYKLDYELYKHLTILNAGFITILMTFLRSLFDVEETGIKGTELIAIAVLLFIVSILACLFGMANISSNLSTSKRQNAQPDSLAHVGTFVAPGSFGIAVLLLVLFITQNFLPGPEITVKAVEGFIAWSAALFGIPILGSRKKWSSLRIGLVSGAIIAIDFGIVLILETVVPRMRVISWSTTIVFTFLTLIFALVIGLFLGGIMAGAMTLIRKATSAVTNNLASG